MELKTWVTTIRKKEFLFVFFDALLLALPGIGLLFVYDHTDFMQLDWIRLVLLGAAIMAPLDFFNMMCLSTILTEFDPKDKEYVFIHITMSIMATAIMVYAIVLLSFLFGKDLHYTVEAVAGIEGVLFVTAFVRGIQQARKQDQTSHAKKEVT